MKKRVWKVSLAIIIVFLFFHPGSGKGIYFGQVKITAVDRYDVKLEPGGISKTVMLKGYYLDKITSIQALINGRPSRDVGAKLGPPSPSTRSLTLKALSTAKPYCCVLIRAIAGEQYIDISQKQLRVEIVAAKPVDSPSAPSTPTTSVKKIEINSVSTHSVKLIKGGDQVWVTVRGNNLELIKNVEVLMNGQATRDVVTRLGSPSSTSRAIGLRAASDAKARCCYELRLIAENEVANVLSSVLKIEIVEPSTPAEAPETTQPVAAPPKLISFNINNNAAETTNRRVRLHIVWEDATQYRANENQSFSGANWQPLSGYMYFNLSSGSGIKVIYVQVRNAQGVTAQAVKDTIELKVEPVSPQPTPSTPTSSDTKIEISSVSTRYVKLIKGNDPVTVTILGNNLGNIKRIEALKNGRTTRDVETRLGSSSTTSRSLKLRAASYASAHCCYELRLIAEQEVINVPSQLFKIEIVEPSTPTEIPETITPEEIPEQTQPLPEAPKLISFNINNNQALTRNKRVRLYIVWDHASQYRASENPNFSQATWKSLVGYMYFDLSSGSGPKTVYVQVRNAQGTVTQVKQDSIELKLEPEILSFSIQDVFQDGSYEGYRWELKTELEVTGSPTSVRNGENLDLSNVNWRPYRVQPGRSYYIYAHREGIGDRTMYIQFKNEEGESNIAKAIFTIPTRREFEITASAARTLSEPYGFIFSSTGEDLTSRCEMESERGYIKLEIPRGPTGSRCDFTLFGGKSLNPGWVFKSYTGRGISPGSGYGYRIERPLDGSRNIKFRIHLWADPLKRCWYTLYWLKIEGPGDSLIEYAFR